MAASTSHMSAALHALGVDHGQGFALHRPERVLFRRTGAAWQQAVGH